MDCFHFGRWHGVCVELYSRNDTFTHDVICAKIWGLLRSGGLYQSGPEDTVEGLDHSSKECVGKCLNT